MRRYLMPAVAITVVLGACGGSGRLPDLTRNVEDQPVVLTSAQLLSIQAGVKQMIVNPESAQFSRATAFTIPPEAGIHVCGYVKYKGENGTYGAHFPYYLELRDKDGKTVAERGQVGSDPSKLSKVKFMCRRHGLG